MMALTRGRGRGSDRSRSDLAGSRRGRIERRCNRTQHWKENGELGSLAGHAADLDRPAMVRDDAMDDRKPEPGTFADGFRREEGLKKPVERLGVHPAPGIDN